MLLNAYEERQADAAAEFDHSIAPLGCKITSGSFDGEASVEVLRYLLRFAYLHNPLAD
jgi:hypothetical protein